MQDFILSAQCFAPRFTPTVADRGSLQTNIMTTRIISIIISILIIINNIVNNIIEFNGFDRAKATEFWVITSDYLYNGGDHMDFFQEGLEIIETNTLIRDAIIEEARSQVILNNDEKSRIK